VVFGSRVKQVFAPFAVPGGSATQVCFLGVRSWCGSLRRWSMDRLSAARGRVRERALKRRTFFNLLAGAIHGGVALAVFIPGLRFLFDPLRRRRNRRGFIRVARLSDVQRDRPLLAQVRTDRWDAYVHHPPGPIGSVWLLKSDDTDSPGSSLVRCLQTECPHLGCAIDFETERHAFICPCHESGFTRDGAVAFGPAPRAMDELPCRVTDPDDQGTRWVEIQYREFKTGTPDQEPRA